jgi:hypothetical protein
MRLLAIEREMYKGWYAMDMVSAKIQMGGGGAYSSEVEDFLTHITFLSKDKTHLYWAMGR